MTTTINASNSGSGGLVQTADASGVLALQTAGTTAVTIDASQNVGIGTASPQAKLDLRTAALGTVLQLSDDTNYGANFIGVSGGVKLAMNGSQTFAIFQSTNERMRIDSSGNLQFNSGYGSVATAYGCRAWVNFNGTGTPAIRGSGNVSSLTDNGTGNYSVNFTTSMPDANYAAVVSTEEGGIISVVSANNTFQQTAGVGRIGVYVGTGGSGYDPEQVNYIVLR